MDIEAGPSGTPTAAVAAGEEQSSAPELTRAELVEEFFRTLFPDDFQLALPVKKHKARERATDTCCGRIRGSYAVANPGRCLRCQSPELQSSRSLQHAPPTMRAISGC